MSLESGLQRLWYGPAWRSLPLWPLSGVFRMVVALRGASYRHGLLRTHRVGAPVIVVGNVSAGGTGKTPVAGWLARELGLRGHQVGIVLRGYGGSHRGPPRVVMPEDDPLMTGDEALVHARRGAHVVVIGADRVAAAKLAVTQGAQVVLCDDGLQHLRLGRDYEIAVVDGARRLGNGRMLPAGPLREPARRLESVQAVVLTLRGPDGDGQSVPAWPPRAGGPPATGRCRKRGVWRATRPGLVCVVIAAARGGGDRSPGRLFFRVARGGPLVHRACAGGSCTPRPCSAARTAGCNGHDDRERCRKMPRVRATRLVVGRTRRGRRAQRRRPAARVHPRARRTHRRGSPPWIASFSTSWPARSARVHCAGTATTSPSSAGADRLAFPVRDGIPVMLESEARPLDSEDPLLKD